MNGNLRAAAVLSIALVISTLIASGAFLRAKNMDHNIVVTGSAKRHIKSDLMIWSAAVTVEAPKLSDAYTQLTKEVEKVREFLVASGIAQNEIITSAVSTTTLRRNARGQVSEYSGDASNLVSGYQLRQSLQVRSQALEKLTAVSRNVTQLINQGILLESEAPKYLYTHLSETKIELLAEAARDARERAQQIASSNGSKAGEMRSAQMGVLQVTAADSTQFTGEGMNDTTSLEKDITAVVHATFSIH